MNHFDFMPIDDLVLIRQYEHEGNKSVIVAPETIDGGFMQEVPVNAQVIAVGPGRWCSATGKRLPMRVKQDDLVLVMSGARSDGFKLNGEMVFVLKENQILGVVREKRSVQ